MNHPHDRTSSIAGNNVKQRRHNNKNNTSTMPLSSSSPAVVTSTKKMKTPTYVEVPFWPEFHWRRIPHEENDVDLNSASFIGYIRICISQNNTNSRQYVYQSVETSDISIDDPCDSDQPSPLIRMNPGNHYRLILINHIDQSTNLHTHGLHISGIGIHDDITRSVDPGNCLVHEYRILDDADIGTFWYHAHRYPIAAEQVGNGAYGVLIVEPTKEQVQQLDYPIPLQQFLFNPTNQVILQYTSVRGDQSDPIPRNKGRTNWINGQTSTINLTWTKSKWYYVRLSTVVISDPINYFEAYPRQACEAHIIAYDGTYRSQIPSNISVHKHMMTASSRLDLAIRCYENATIHFHQRTCPDPRVWLIYVLLIRILAVRRAMPFTTQLLSPYLPAAIGMQLPKLNGHHVGHTIRRTTFWIMMTTTPKILWHGICRWIIFKDKVEKRS